MKEGIGRVNTTRLASLVLGACALSPAGSIAQTRLLRFPDLHGDRVVFCHGGDLWVAPVSGGAATRLTAHQGLEVFPRFSPDGKWIAFTGQYDGDEQVYVLPAEGGSPRQLTFYPAIGPLPPRWGYDNQVYGWTRDGSLVLFRSAYEAKDHTQMRLYTVSPDGGLPAALPMVESGGGDYSPDGTKVAFSPLARDFRSWKRYQGGWAQDLFIFDLTTHDSEKIAAHVRTERDPMWIGSTIYFASDRTGTLNLFSHDTVTREVKQVTFYQDWDVRWPSRDEEGRIVFELGGELKILDTRLNRVVDVPIRVLDDGLHTRATRVAVAGKVEDFDLSPKGERGVFVARGDVFSVPVKKGPTRNLTNTQGAHERLASWSPDGSKILFVSDQSGEEELYVVPQDGVGSPTQITRDGSCRREAPRFSPDGKRISISNCKGELWVHDAETGQGTLIVKDPIEVIRDHVWSPCSMHLAFSMNERNGQRSIHVWSVEGGALKRVTDKLFNEFSPAWDPEGSYLYYLSNRSFSPQICSFDWNYAVSRSVGVYGLALRKDVKHLFPIESDEVTIDKEEKGKEEEKKEGEEAKEGATEPPKEEQAGAEGEPAQEESKKSESEVAAKDQAKEEDKKNKEEEDKPKLTVIDFDGIESRVVFFPIPADNYAGLSAVKGHVLFLKTQPFFYGREPAGQGELQIFAIKERKVTTLSSGANGYALSADGNKVMVSSSGAYTLYDANPGGGSSGTTVSTSEMYAERDPAQEWPEIFLEAWRRFRDYFYVDNMHGYDWVELRERYRPLLAHVAHRSDLNYVISEMIAELNCSHAYVTGGDFDLPPRPLAALLGARFQVDKDSNSYRIAHIHSGQNEEGNYRSPLREVGVDAREGDFLLEINGKALSGQENIYERLIGLSGQPVTLTLNDKPSTEGARKVTCQPCTSEGDLVYLEWVEKNRRFVEEASNGRFGYLHVPDMGAKGLREFIKWFYGQLDKEGLIIDVRGNGGGNVSQMLIERLKRTLLSLGFRRGFDVPDPYPEVVFHGNLVCLLDEDSASDGDIFPAMFKKAGLGPLIGKRSWGGVIGITDHGPLLDGGSINVPEFGFNDIDGSWVIEGHGVDPDIEVENDPKSTAGGRDPQLERAIAELEKLNKEQPRIWPTRPAAPVRTK